jgi:arachidonate 15-lipoxygenase
MRPKLPGEDSNRAVRVAQLARARETWRVIKRYKPGPLDPGLSFAEEVPIRDQFSAGFGAEVARVGAAALLNQTLLVATGRYADKPLAASLQNWIDLLRARFAPEVGLAAPNIAAAGAPAWQQQPSPRRVKRARSSTPGHQSDLRFPINVSAYTDLYASISQPEVVVKFGRAGAFQDRAFAWQRLAGANPMVLTQIRPGERSIAELPFTDAEYGKATGFESETREAALREGRLYVADYRLLGGLPDGTAPDGSKKGLKKYMCAPIAWFAALPATPTRLARFVPIAIQCDQPRLKPFKFHPWDGVKWMMARTAVQMADSNLQEMVYHLGRTHLVMEAVILAARRNLAENHPLMVLFEPHFEFTLAINDYASRHLIAPHGEVERLLGSTLEGSLSLTAKGMAAMEFRLLAPPRDLAARGVDCRETLPEYPYRDDALLVWGAIRRFVERYVRVYYESDEDVVSDVELTEFREALIDVSVGGLNGVDPIQTRENLVDLVATIIFTASAQHSALNYAQFPFMGFAPNAPAALYAAPPTDATKDELDEWLSMLPPPVLALPQFALLYQLSSVRWSRLGHYSPLQFLDPRVWQSLIRFRWDLESIDAQIRAADADRFLSYPFLLPSLLGNSVFI